MDRRRLQPYEVMDLSPLDDDTELLKAEDREEQETPVQLYAAAVSNSKISTASDIAGGLESNQLRPSGEYTHVLMATNHARRKS